MIPSRASYRQISLYAPNRAPCRIDLSDNTNLWGIPPAAEQVLRQCATATVTRYPALYANALKEAIAAYLGVAPQNVVTGCGSDDVLDSAIRAFGEPGDTLAFPEPSFAMMPLFAQMNALLPAPVSLTASFDIDAAAMLRTFAKVFYVCSPNNPTGTVASRAAIEQLQQGCEGVVILDEAYAEYAESSMAAEAPGSERLLVVRTLSKAFGLAGMRIGYAVGPPALIAEVEKSRGPYKVSALAERMGVAALTEDLPWVRTHIEEAKQLRERSRQQLQAAGFEVLPSEANFLLVKVADATQASQRLRAKGIALRPFPGLRGLGDCLRISMGPWPLLDEALSALVECAR